MLTKVAVRTDSENGFRITVNDKILVHLLEYIKYQERPEAPREVTQQGMAEIISARRSHISLALTTLKERGLVEERTCRVTDEVRRRKVYGLTPKGFESAKKLLAEFNERKVRIEEASGVKEVRIVDLPEVLGEKYYNVDVLCCISRDGTLDIAALTGQKAETTVAQEREEPQQVIQKQGEGYREKVEEPAFQPPPTVPEKTAEGPVAAIPETEAKILSTVATCPFCLVAIQFPYREAEPTSVICGACGKIFNVTVGTPTLDADYAAPLDIAEGPRGIVKEGGAMSCLGLGAMFAIVADVLLFLPNVLALSCIFAFISIPFLMIAAVAIKPTHVGLMIGFSAAALLIAPFLFLSPLSALIGVSLEFVATSMVAAAAISLRVESNAAKFWYGAAFAIIGAAIPAMGPVGVPIGAGLLVGSACLISLTAFGIDRDERKEVDALVTSALIATAGTISLIHWVMRPRWDWGQLGRIFLIAAALYAFAAFARPVSPRIRSEGTFTLGVFMMAFATSVIVTPWLGGLALDSAAFLVLLGAGAAYLANRIQKLAYPWVLVCLAVGLFIITASVATLAAKWGSISIAWQLALVMWAAAGGALCAAKFAPQVVEHLASLRAGFLGALGASLALAGAYMFSIGVSVEGAVEIGLGVPLLGFALFKSGAPWVQRLSVTGLFVATVAATWIAFVIPA